MIRMTTGSPAHAAEAALGRIERRARPDKHERLLADTGLAPVALREVPGWPAADITLRDARSFPARSLALDGLR